MTSDSVSVISRHTVRCANEGSWTSLDSPFRLGPLDQLVAPSVPIAVVFVYTSSPGVELIPVERLERSLTLLLDYYPHLTGRLQINSSDGTPEISRLGTGAELFVARCSERLDASDRILLPNLPGAGNALLAPFDPSLEGVCRDPIFTVQHTRFACGGVALGVRLHHITGDADGFFQLVGDLAELYRNGDSLAHPPHIRSYLSELTPEERVAALEFEPSQFYVEQSPAFSSYPVTSPSVGRFLRFSSSELNALKAPRLSLREKDPTLPELSPPDFLTPVNLRSRIGLPPRYFPNALHCQYTSLSHDLLANGPLWQVAKALHDLTRTTSTTSKEEVDRTYRWIAAQPDKRKIKQGFRYGTGSLMISQWNKMDMYAGSVFDVAPVLVAPPFTPISLVDGLGYFIPTGEQGGDIDVALSLSEPIWEFIDQDEHFD
ncbi:transferase family-domain-containing protein [Armillaria borealis]|uniref:Transferase family-domain-containing protein n=1 Tax=Armillaria borealis TaxID=47425 RepID=A0AA39K5V2_9AGAR|nr:transferase family-domain-containing protein [Armillaria borealis]